MFIDRATVHLTAGRGGNGVVAWRREKYIPKGGPTGGNGGKGGSVVFKANSQLSCLEWFRNRRLLKAENGQPGGPNRRQGRAGQTLILEVPCGTLIKDPETEEVLCDLTEDGMEWIACVGGIGGRGNDSFKSAVNRAPNTCTPGREGEARDVELELKLIADVGLVGFPNAGKSTLINALTDVKVKIAPYPFTTLRPNLGFMTTPDHKRIFIADIPGIIEGAHRNRGLGFEFLRHIERTKLLLFVLDASGIDGRDPSSDYLTLRAEVETYNPELMLRPFLVLLNKIDVEEAKEHIEAFHQAFSLEKGTCFEVSAACGDGLKELRSKILEMNEKILQSEDSSV